MQVRSHTVAIDAERNHLHAASVVVVVVVVYLTTNQRHLGYLSLSNGHLAGRYSTP